MESNLTQIRGRTDYRLLRKEHVKRRSCYGRQDYWYNFQGPVPIAYLFSAMGEINK